MRKSIDVLISLIATTAVVLLGIRCGAYRTETLPRWVQSKGRWRTSMKPGVDTFQCYFMLMRGHIRATLGTLLRLGRMQSSGREEALVAKGALHLGCSKAHVLKLRHLCNEAKKRAEVRQ